MRGEEGTKLVVIFFLIKDAAFLAFDVPIFSVNRSNDPNQRVDF